MYARKKTRIIDTITGERFGFEDLGLATEWLRRETGRKTGRSLLSHALKSGKTIYDRYRVEEAKQLRKKPDRMPDVMRHVGRSFKERGWLFEEFSFSDSVVVASKARVKGTAERMREIEEMASPSFRAHIEDLDREESAGRDSWNVELYLKSPDASFKEKVKLMKEVIKGLGLLD